MSKIIKVAPANPHPEAVREAVRIIQSGGVVSFPTRYLYGLGADPLNPEAVERIFDIKQRAYDKPISVLVRNQKDFARLVRSVSPAASRIMDAFWPGGITIVFEARELVPANLTANTGKIGVRLPLHPVASALVDALKGPVTATSANIAGDDGCSRISDLDEEMSKKLDLILDAGPLKGGVGSTVVDVTSAVPKIIREGAVSSKDIFAVLDN